MKKIALVLGIGAALTGCGTLNNALVEKTKNVEYYRIFKLETDADRYAVAEAASNGLGRNVNSATEANPIPNYTETPDKPGRFKIENPLAGTKMAAFMGGGGSLGFKVATCEGAIWTASANRNITGSSDLRLTACLWEYKGGYHLDTYAAFQKAEGGIMQISREMANAMVGTPEEWTEKTFIDIARAVHKETGAKITYLEGYPKLSGTPWLDDYDKM
tara:strand:- start:3322 stop:3972 length:651 start_codon:yes stop_codon:yes gene_type:complete